jgi:hypothetical protein
MNQLTVLLFSLLLKSTKWRQKFVSTFLRSCESASLPRAVRPPRVRPPLTRPCRLLPRPALALPIFPARSSHPHNLIHDAPHAAAMDICTLHTPSSNPRLPRQRPWMPPFLGSSPEDSVVARVQRHRRFLWLPPRAAPRRRRPRSAAPSRLGFQPAYAATKRC